jgi:hypothetical protein
MIKLFLTTLSLIASTICLCGDSQWCEQKRIEFQKEGLPYIMLPAAAVINKLLQNALGELKYQEYIERNIDICDHLDGKFLSVPALGLAIISTVLGYNENEKKEIQSAVLTILAKQDQQAMLYLREHAYIK